MRQRVGFSLATDDVVDLSSLPSVSHLLDHVPEIRAAVDRVGHAIAVDAVRQSLSRARALTIDGHAIESTEVVADVLARIEAWESGRTRPVINATGVILHTNLGRAPLSDEAIAAAVAVAGYTNVEYDLETAQRGGRGARLRAMTVQATGAESATVVNNGAAALVLALAAVAGGRDVVCSRGELIEIGGSFRLPEMVEASGVVLREVGTTNRTRVEDYARAIHDDTGALLTVHPSNYQVTGFTERPDLAGLVTLARASRVPLIHDLGSGLLDGESGAFHREPAVRASIAAGVDLAIFSGDKLLGGPQAGFIVGRADLVERCAAHPLARTMRLDKQRIAALEATLEAHVGGRRDALPVWGSLLVDVAALEQRARAIAVAVHGRAIATDAVVGGGAAPGVTLPSWGVALPGEATTVLARLRSGVPPVIGRRVGDWAVLDLRAVASESDAALIAAGQLARRDIPE